MCIYIIGIEQQSNSISTILSVGLSALFHRRVNYTQDSVLVSNHL